MIYVRYVLINISYTHPFNGPLSGTTRVSQYQKGKTNLDITEARDSEWQWHQLGHMQVCTSLQTDNHASTPPLSFFTGQMHFLLPNQQSQSTEGGNKYFLLANIFPLKKPRSPTRCCWGWKTAGWICSRTEEFHPALVSLPSGHAAAGPGFHEASNSPVPEALLPNHTNSK